MGPTQRYMSIARSDLAAVIYDALDSAAELILDDTVQALVDDGERVRVRFESGQARDFDLVVGADGLHSRVRRLAFGPDQAYEKYLGIVVAAFEAEGYRPRDELIAMMHAEVGFQAVRVSFRDDHTLFLLTVRHDGPVPEDDRAAQEALLRTRLAGKGWETSAMLDLMPQAITFYFDSVSQIRMPSWTRGRVALVGDAAACPSFLAGQGSALAMVESYTLAAELSRCTDYSKAFANYEADGAPEGCRSRDGQELSRRRRATDVRRGLSRPARSHGSTAIGEAGRRQFPEQRRAPGTCRSQRARLA